jgi:hypothetical protein
MCPLLSLGIYFLYCGDLGGTVEDTHYRGGLHPG